MDMRIRPEMAENIHETVKDSRGHCCYREIRRPTFRTTGITSDHVILMSKD
jgi:hypothetical protein